MDIWIFECDALTQFECWEKSLFGSNIKWPLTVKNGDFCLFYNYSEHLIYGVYQTTSDGRNNIIPEAWGGEYPFQVKVRLWSRERIAVPLANINRFVTNQDTRRVRNKVFGEPADELLQYFAGGYSRSREAGQQMDGIEEDFRRRYPRQYHCSDGHDVRSLSEQSIDEWLSAHQVYHENERLTNIPEHLVPDFTVYTTDKRPVFIEFWGMLDDAAYQQRRRHKCEVYNRHRCTLIELYPDDLRNLDFALRKKLRDNGVDVHDSA